MFRHLLVSVDGTLDGGPALSLARTIAAALDARVTLVREEPRTGSVARAVADVVYAQHCDLVVSASQGAGGPNQPEPEIIDSDLFRAITVPLLLLGPASHGWTELRTVLAMVDEAPGGLRALTVAAPLAQATGARVVVVEAIAPSSPTATTNPFECYWEEATLARAGEFVTDQLSHLTSGGVKAQAIARYGAVAKTILSVVDEIGADLIVMSTHLRLSVAVDVVRDAPCPVLLIHRHQALVNGTSDGS
jgi:nucleotide-binding universal stress UspA family protein